MNKKQRLVAKKHRKNKARIKTLKQAAISAGNKVKKNTSSKVATTMKPAAKKTPTKKVAIKKKSTKKVSVKKAPIKKKATKKSTAKISSNKSNKKSSAKK